MRRPAIIASILTLLVACDKPQQLLPGLPAEPLSSISDSSSIFFQLYGSRDEPRLVPFAIVESGKLAPISLDAEGWRNVDERFFAAGRKMPLYRDGIAIGDVEITRRMWDPTAGALYTLPGCSDVIPQATGKLLLTNRAEASVEFLASTTPLKQKATQTALPADAESVARAVASAVATSAKVGTEEMSHLEFISRWLRTGAGPQGRTLLASFVDPEAGDAGAGTGHTVSLLALAEDSADSMATSYRHVSQGEGRTVEFRRLVNHADLDGDGIDEIILESWRYAATPQTVVLKYAGGRWTESLRVSQDWCLDKKAARP